MICKSFEELIALYVEGDLDSSQAGDVERHLGSCLSCQRLLAGLKASQAMVREMAAESPDPASLNVVRNSVMQEVSRRQATRDPWSRFLTLFERRPAWAVAVAVLAALGFLLQWELWRRPAGPDKPDTPVATVQERNPKVTAPNPLERTGPEPEQRSFGLEPKQFARRRHNSLPLELPAVAPPDTVTEDSQPPVEQGSILAPEPPQPTDVAPESPPPLVIKLITDDPNIVIVWLVDQEVHHN